MSIENSLPDDQRDLRRLFERSAPAPNPVDVDDLLSRCDRRIKPARRSIYQFHPMRKKVAMTLRYACAVSVVAICCFAIMSIVQSPSNRTLAFEQVQNEVAKTRSVQYLSQEIYPSDNTDADAVSRDSYAQYAQQVIENLEWRIAKIQEELSSSSDESTQQRLRDEQNTRETELASVKRRLLEHGDKPWTKRILVLGRYKQRTEFDGISGMDIMITNMETGEVISLDHQRKSATILSTQVVLDQETGERTRHSVKPDKTVDFYGHVNDLPAEAKKLEETIRIDGRQMTGFRSVQEDGSDTWTRTFWIDPMTELPRRIEIQYRSSAPNRGSVDWIMSEIVFDQELDEALFDTTPPEGYSTGEGGFISIE